MRRQQGQDDTICAISTAIGLSGIGVVRVSGTDALRIVQPLFKGSSELAKAQSHTALYGQVIDPSNQETVDEALFLIMKAPRTYTGEDIVEIQTHGSPLILEKILSLLSMQGARLATPGEFTRRSFLSGRIDLAQAEAVMELITAENWDHHGWALSQLKGTLSKRVGRLRERLLQILAHIEASIDFSEEGISFWTDSEMSKEIVSVSEEVGQLLAGFSEGRRIRDGFAVVIVGRPNVGKSSLMNLLLEEDRAIVTPVPGTTRDVLQESIHIDGLLFQITDTAGYRETNDPIEAEGVRRGEEALEKADLILWVLDSSEAYREEDHILSRKLKGKRKIILLNKADLPTRLEGDRIRAENPDEVIVSFSTVTGAGLKDLKIEIKRLLGKQPEKERRLVALLRHRNAMEAAAKSLLRARKGAEERASWEFLAADLREATDSLGEIVGETTTDEILDQIFNQFCIGK
jgi:tRNA modification GTPase